MGLSSVGHLTRQVSKGIPWIPEQRAGAGSRVEAVLGFEKEASVAADLDLAVCKGERAAQRVRLLPLR